MPKKSDSRKRTLLAFIVIVALAIVAFFALQGPPSSVENQEGESLANVGGNVGQTAPKIQLRTIDDGFVRLQDLKGKPTVLWFMAAWCPTCIGQSLDLKKINEDFGDNINIVTIDLWVPSTLGDSKGTSLPAPPETESDLREFREKFGGDWIWAMDTDMATFKFQIRVVDSTILVDDEGIVAYRRNGPTGYDDLAEAIAGVL